MENSEGKLDIFTKEVVKEAKNQKEVIIKEAKNEVQHVLEEKEIEFLEQAYKNIQKKLRIIEREKNEKVAFEQQKSKKKILLERENLIENTFDLVAERLHEYCESKDYNKYLEKQIKEVLDYLDKSSLEIMKRDENLFKELIDKTKKDTKITISDEDIIGGFILKNDKMLIDLTLKSKLEDKREKFMENTDLGVF